MRIRKGVGATDEKKDINGDDEKRFKNTRRYMSSSDRKIEMNEKDENG